MGLVNYYVIGRLSLSLSPFFPFYFALASLSSHLFLFFFDQAGFEEEKGKEKVADRWRRVLGGNPRFVENEEEERRGTVIKQ